MDVWMETLGEIMNKQMVMETFVDILLCAASIWLALMIGLFIGWFWKARWTGLVFLDLRSKLWFSWTALPGFGAHRIWLAFTAFSAFSLGRRLLFRSRDRNSEMDSSPTPAQRVVAESSSDNIRAITGSFEMENNVVTENDLEHLLHLLDGKDGEMAWQSMIECSTSNLAYQAWRHELEIGPVVYRSKTVFEDATPDLVRDFFWDDEFQSKWDAIDREYIIRRKIWEAQRSYYCVTKGVPYPALTTCNKPRRVDLYFSSWLIKPVQSLNENGQLSTCEVTLIHYEDMGIPKDVAKLGVPHLMWGTVKKVHTGFRLYQNVRKSEAILSRCALMASFATKISSDEDNGFLKLECSEEEKADTMDIHGNRRKGGIDWRWVAIGGWTSYRCDWKSVFSCSRPKSCKEKEKFYMKSYMLENPICKRV